MSYPQPRTPLFSVEPLEDAAPQYQPQQPPRQPPQSVAQDAAFGAVMLGLKALSQRSVIALSRLANLAMVASVFWLFMSIPSPTTYQIVWGGMYAVFILVLVWLNNRLT